MNCPIFFSSLLLVLHTARRLLAGSACGDATELDGLIADLVVNEWKVWPSKHPVFISTCVLLGGDLSPQKSLPGNTIR